MRHKTTVEQINRSAAAARSAMGGDPGGPSEAMAPRRRRSAAPDDDSFFDHYFKRIEPQVAASFTPVQRQAIKTMFGARGIMRHAVDIRRGITIGASRFYLVLLLGRERRAPGALPRSALDRVVGYFVLAFLLLAPIFVAFYLLKTLAGIDVLAAGGPPSAVIAQEPPPNLSPF